MGFGFTILDISACAHRGLEDFDDGDATLAVEAWKQALRKNETESLGKTAADALLIFEGKSADNALDRFSGVDRVKSGENEVPGFGSFESNFNGFAVLRGAARKAAEKVGVSL